MVVCVDVFHHKHDELKTDNVLVLVTIAKYLGKMHADVPSNDIVESISRI